MEKNKSKKRFLAGLFSVTAACCTPFLFAGCSENGKVDENAQSVFITGIEKATANSDGSTNFIVSYSNGKSSIITLENNNQTTNTITIDELFNKYKETNTEASFEDFVAKYLSIPKDNRQVINDCLNSCLKIYTEYTTTTISGDGFFSPYQQQKTVSRSCGSGVIYYMQKSENPDENYSYVITNYHVIYNMQANEDNNKSSPSGANKFARRIVGYLYGSEDTPTQDTTGTDGYPTYDYGNYGIEFEYIGGSITHDIAILKTNTSNLLRINGNAKAVEFADNYQVGETAIAIGNPENEGISVTEGVVSVDNEFIQLSIDNTVRNYRSIRMDTSIYGGSSGGGLFNTEGKLIGITNAGNGDDQNINYAVPVDIVRAVSSNIMRNYHSSNKTTPVTVTKITLGITLQDDMQSKYIYDPEEKQCKIVDTSIIESIVENSIAQNNLNLKVGDKIKAIVINDVTTKFDRYFEIGDAILYIKANDVISFVIERENEDGQFEQMTTPSYTVLPSDLN